MPNTLSRSLPPKQPRSWKFYALVTFSVTLFVVGVVFLALMLNRYAHSYHKPVPATFDGIGWKIEAEHYDEGGEGVAYHDAFPGNILYEFNPERKRPGEYRNDDVEIWTKNPGQLIVGFILEGEWLMYTIDVPQTGMYDLDLNVAAMHPDRRISFELDGQPLPQTVTLPQTGDWGNFEIVTMPGGVHLSKGKHTLKMVFDESYMNVDWLRLTPLSAAGGRGGIAE